MELQNIARALLSACIISLTLVVCSGGGGGSAPTDTAGNNPVTATTISGTVAAGAPMIGTVTVKDMKSGSQEKMTLAELIGKMN